MEAHQKPAFGRVHRNFAAPGSMCFRLSPGNWVRPLHDDTLRDKPEYPRSHTIFGPRQFSLEFEAPSRVSSCG
jgi:hypothetical protein